MFHHSITDTDDSVEARIAAARATEATYRTQSASAFMRDINREADRLFRSVKGRAR